MNSAATSAPPGQTDVRQHILDVAYPLFLHKGFTAVGLAEVLAAARVPKGSFYHYFGSKEAFGEAVIDEYFTVYLGQVDALLNAPGSAAQRLLSYFRFWLESQTGAEAQSRCLMVKLGAEVCDLSDSMRGALERGTRGVTERLARCIAQGQADGSLPGVAAAQPWDSAVLLYQTWLGASLLAKISRQRGPLDTALAATRQLLGIAV
ncbi:TetR/AcrR family transcriptional regulator [Massilia arenosa]|uniref:TetR/AcrR family transcriptional regulator n=1 Tax=Zemynaea arenosa TaxID=2561931 RepID=A0A4Y9S9S3_9BURK|nr:TetR/AcrR family transcriptional regulator [Massilia arenosa]TFW16833.1 TetR/AcrR family transcriptional regulator [Massilia arenosa]